MFSNNSMDVTLRKTEFDADQGGPQLEQVYVRSQAVVSRRVAGETLIVPVRGKVGDLASIYSFNQTGSLIWQSMESPKTLRELISDVQREYAVAREQAEKDVKQFLQDTLSVGLVEVREQASMAAMNSTGYGELQSGSR
jgi:Coenzyme PQQ synthesis protein D (PqqD)